jgi:hypothetical protein
MASVGKMEITIKSAKRIPCKYCQYAVVTKSADWPFECHRHAPNMPLENDNAAYWPALSVEQARQGCADVNLISEKLED